MSSTYGMPRADHGGDILKADMELLRGGISLSPEQVRVVDHVVSSSQITVVSAGAGSGKTRTMVATSLHLIETKPINSDRIALITFTNKATDEMRERLQKGIDERLKAARGAKDKSVEDFWFEQKERLSSCFIGTIHSFCSYILRLFGYEENVPHDKEVVLSNRFFYKALQETLNQGMENPETRILFVYRNVQWLPYQMTDYLTNLYQYIRNKGRKIEDVIEETLGQEQDKEFPYRRAIVRMLEMLELNYEQLKQRENVVDPNDLLEKTACLLEKHHDVIGPLLAQRFSYLFVDEFQDTDKVQKRIINALLPYLEHVLMVGDRKQAIYGFRGADDSILQEMADEHGEEILLLKASHRPTKPLFEAQTELFRFMSKHYKVLGELLTLPPHGAHTPQDKIIPFEFILIPNGKRDRLILESIEKVRDYCSQEIDPGNGEEKRPVKYRDICFLFRTNFQMEMYEKAFKEAGIPVIRDEGGGFFRRPEIIACYYMLQAILRYPDDVALDLALNSPFLPFKHTVPLLKHDHSSNPLWDWFRGNEESRSWYEGMMEIRKRSKIDLVPQLLIRLFEFTAVREYYAAQGDIQAVANLEKLVTWARQIMNTEALTLQQFFDRFQNALLSDEELMETDIGEEEKKDAVIFSTVHSSKGLEYPIVIIPEVHRSLLVEQNLPKYFDEPGFGLDIILPGGRGPSQCYYDWMEKHKKSFLEEEARVLYVAITRAKHAICFISGGKDKKNRRGSKDWSWKDEIIYAYNELNVLSDSQVKFQRKY